MSWESQSRARESIARAGIGLGGSELAGAERSARELVRTAPFRESGYVLLMRALVASGNTAEALRAYERLRRVLREELGTAPGAEIQALHRRLLTGRESVDDPVEAATTAPIAAAGPGAAVAELPLPTWLIPTRRSPFVGRSGEIGRLAGLWDEAAEGRPQIVLVGGDPGMGKTRLATEFAQGVHDAAGSGPVRACRRTRTLSYQLRESFATGRQHSDELQASLGRHAAVLAKVRRTNLPEPPAVASDEPSSRFRQSRRCSRPTLLVITISTGRPELRCDVPPSPLATSRAPDDPRHPPRHQTAR